MLPTVLSLLILASLLSLASMPVEAYPPLGSDSLFYNGAIGQLKGTNSNFTLGSNIYFRDVAVNLTHLWLDKSFSFCHASDFCLWTGTGNVRLTISSWFSSTTSSATLYLVAPSAVNVQLSLYSSVMVSASASGAVSQTYTPSNKTLTMIVNTAYNPTIRITATVGEMFDPSWVSNVVFNQQFTYTTIDLDMVWANLTGFRMGSKDAISSLRIGASDRIVVTQVSTNTIKLSPQYNYTAIYILGLPYLHTVIGADIIQSRDGFIQVVTTGDSVVLNFIGTGFGLVVLQSIVLIGLGGAIACACIMLWAIKEREGRIALYGFIGLVIFGALFIGSV